MGIALACNLVDAKHAGSGGMMHGCMVTYVLTVGACCMLDAACCMLHGDLCAGSWCMLHAARGPMCLPWVHGAWFMLHGDLCAGSGCILHAAW